MRLHHVRRGAPLAIGASLLVHLFFSLGAGACGDDAEPDARTTADASDRSDGATESQPDAALTDGPTVETGVRCQVTPCATDLAAGYAYACAIMSDRTVRCWGADQMIYPDGGATAVPQVVQGLEDVVEIAAGNIRLCARHPNGNVECTDRGSGLRPYPLPGPAAQLSVGFLAECMRLVDGRVFCSGPSEDGALGVATEAVDSGVVATPTAMEGVAQATDVSVYTGYTCVIMDGGVYCVGRNNHQQLGFSGPYSVALIRDTTAVPLPAAATHLSAANFNVASCATVANGDAWCWGDNGLQAIPMTDASATAPVPVNVPDIVQMDSTGGTTCGVTRSGEVYCWGIDFVADKLGTPPTKVNGFPAKVVRVGVGYAFQCALLETGAVYCWGTNLNYELGRGAAGLDAATIDGVSVPVAF